MCKKVYIEFLKEKARFGILGMEPRLGGGLGRQAFGWEAGVQVSCMENAFVKWLQMKWPPSFSPVDAPSLPSSSPGTFIASSLPPTSFVSPQDQNP